MTDGSYRQRGKPARPDDGEFELWRERLADVPDLRIAKVMRVRRAIATNDYDEQAILERALNAIHNEVGIMCREEFEEL